MTVPHQAAPHTFPTRAHRDARQPSPSPRTSIFAVASEQLQQLPANADTAHDASSTEELLDALMRSALHLIAQLRAGDAPNEQMAAAVVRYVADAERAHVPPSHVSIALELLVNEHTRIPAPTPTLPTRHGDPLARERARRKALRPLVAWVLRVAASARTPHPASA